MIKLFLSQLNRLKILGLFIIILFGGIMYVERSYISPVIPQGGSLNSTVIVKYVPVQSSGVIVNREIKPDHLLRTDYYMFQFEKNFEKNVDFTQLNSNWGHLSEKEKLDWIRSHFYFNSLDSGILEFGIAFSKTDSKNNSYINDNVNLLLDNGVNYITTISKEFYPDYKVVVVGRNITADTLKGAEEPNKISNVRYAVVGAVLGFIITLLIACVMTIKRYYYDK